MIAPIRSKVPQIYQLHIVLAESKPTIWRRVLVLADYTLAKLHQIIQCVMPWHECHLHEFRIGDCFYGRPDLTEDHDGKVLNETRVKLSRALKSIRRFLYIYDFGDSWKHEIAVEAVIFAEDGVIYPLCSGGENVGPPENSGSMWGYYDKLDILKNPQHPAYAETREWMPENWDPALFDLEAANRALKASNV